MNIVNLIQGMLVSRIYIVILDTLSRGAVQIGVPNPIPVGMPTWLPNTKLPTVMNIRNKLDPCIRTSETRSFRTRDNARVEPNALFQDMRIEADDREWGDRKYVPNANLSERLLEQQMNVMRDLLQLITIQNTRMRNHSDTGNEFRVMPEKYAGTSSFHTFLAQFENCCEINGWEERDKLLMLKHSLTGDAAAVLWEFGSDRHQSYTELVKHLKIRY